MVVVEGKQKKCGGGGGTKVKICFSWYKELV